MSLKVKLISCISLFMLMLGVLIIGVYAATQTINLKGSVEFDIDDTSLYIRDIRVQTEPTGSATTIDDFIPGYVNQSIELNLGTVQSNSGSVNVYFDFVNTTSTVYQATATGGSGVVLSTSGVINGSGTPIENVPTADISGTITLTIQFTGGTAGKVDLDGIVINIKEYVPTTIETIAVGQTTTGEMLGTATGGGEVEIEQQVTLSADFTGNADADFLGWKLNEDDTEFVSTLPDYKFTFTEESPTTYYAIFETANNNLTYSYTTSSGTASVSDCDTSIAGDLVIPSAIYRTSRQPSEYSVTSIGAQAFTSCYNLTSITIPDSVTSLAELAFYQCISLTSITIPSSVTSIGAAAFNYCSSLTSIEIPDGVTSIGGSAFYGCSSLSSIEIPSSVTSIGGSAFYDCSSLSSIEIPSSVTSIGGSAFYFCSSLTSITIPEGVTSIEATAFSYCSGLETITVEEGNTVYHSDGNCLIETASKTLIAGCKNSVIPDDGTVTSIDLYTFEGCSGLTSITIPDSVTSIGRGAFDGCSSLESVTIPEGVTSISRQVFRDCSNLKSITIPDRVTSIGDSAFYGCSSLTSITIPSSVTSIGDEAFRDCSNLKSITIPDRVTSIGDSAFYGCSSLTSITIPDSVISIGDSAFYKCSSLTSITIPDRVTSIGRRAFFACSRLSSITFNTPYSWEISSSSSFSSIYATLTASQVRTNALTYLTDDYENYYWRAVV